MNLGEAELLDGQLLSKIFCNSTAGSAVRLMRGLYQCLILMCYRFYGNTTTTTYSSMHNTKQTLFDDMVEFSVRRHLFQVKYIQKESPVSGLLCQLFYLRH